MAHKKKRKKKIQIFVDKHGITHMIIIPKSRNEMHFDIQRNTHAVVIPDKKHKKPRYKKNFQEEE